MKTQRKALNRARERYAAIRCVVSNMNKYPELINFPGWAYEDKGKALNECRAAKRDLALAIKNTVNALAFRKLTRI